VTKKALKLGIKKTKIGNTVGDIGNTVQRHVESQGFNVVRELTGHGIGKDLHEEPEVLNYGQRGKGEKLKKGMVICIEPMVTMGDYKLKRSSDGFGFETKDGSLAAHFEHTIAVTEKGPEILTRMN
jgi:methionyl aminopeptidase